MCFKERIFIFHIPSNLAKKSAITEKSDKTDKLLLANKEMSSRGTWFQETVWSRFHLLAPATANILALRCMLSNPGLVEEAQPGAIC